MRVGIGVSPGVRACVRVRVFVEGTLAGETPGRQTRLESAQSRWLVSRVVLGIASSVTYSIGYSVTFGMGYCVKSFARACACAYISRCIS